MDSLRHRPRAARPPARRVRRRGPALALASTLAVVRAALAADAPLPVVVTVPPLAMLVEEVGGERVQVRSLVPPGATPHTFEPRPGDLAALADARLFLRVGAGLDDWASRLAAAGGSGLVSEALTALDGAGAAPDDPHVWLDPIDVRDRLAPALARRLTGLDPDGAAHYRARLADFQQRLGALDARIRAILAQAPRRGFVAFHGAWRPFAARYELREVAVVEEFPGEEPTPAELARLVEAARAAGVAAILVEPQLDPRIARVLAAEFGGGTVLVDPLGDPGDPRRARYEALLLFDAAGFRQALGEAPRE